MSCYRPGLRVVRLRRRLWWLRLGLRGGLSGWCRGRELVGGGWCVGGVLCRPARGLVG